MGTIERRQRQIEANRREILDAALMIARKEGWQGLSMRKIADQIEYSPTMIYEYFSSKEALLTELTRLGFLRLVQEMKNAAGKTGDPKERLLKMWLAYWDFAFAGKEFYQLMFGLGTSCHTYPVNTWGAAQISAVVIPVIHELLSAISSDENAAACKYYAYWSAVHGLVSLNFLDRSGSDEFNMEILLSTLKGITIADLH